MNIPNGMPYKEALSLYSVRNPIKVARFFDGLSKELLCDRFDPSKFLEELYLRYVHASPEQMKELQFEYMCFSLIMDAVKYASRLRNPTAFNWYRFLDRWMEPKDINSGD